jgi:hypothetical protein
LSALLLLLAAGCGGGKATNLAEVSGTVKFDGKPLPGVVVTFYPEVEKEQPALPRSRATTDASGRYTLTCVELDKPGAVVGKHRVVVSWPVRPGADRLKHPDPFPIPAVYTVASATPLEKDVAAGPNMIDLDLKNQ